MLDIENGVFGSSEYTLGSSNEEDLGNVDEPTIVFAVEDVSDSETS